MGSEMCIRDRLYALWIILGEQPIEYIYALLMLGCGFGAGMILGFMATIYVSGERVYITLYFIMLFVTMFCIYRMADAVEEKIKQRRSHRLNMEDRKRLEMTGISDVISFDLNKILLETDYGVVTVKGDNLHVNRLSVEKGELDIDGSIQSLEYSEVSSFGKKGESFFSRLMR